jgi:hypothetical protein
VGTMLVLSGGGTSSVPSDPVALTPGGRLYVPPAYIQTSSDAAVQLTSEIDKVAFGFIPDVDFALSSVSFFVTAIGTTGNVGISLHKDGSAVEPNGIFYNPSTVNSLAALSSNGSDCSATSETEGFEAHKAFNHTASADDGWRSTATPTGGSPQALIRDLGAGNEQAFNRFRLWTFSSSDANVRAFPKTFTIDADQNDNNWVTLVTVASETAVGWNASGQNFREHTCINPTAYQRYRINITDRDGTNAYVSIGELEMFSGETRPAPGAQLTLLGTTPVGEVADAWVRHTFDAYQLKRNMKYWLVFSQFIDLGDPSKDFSLSKRRMNPSNGSAFPEGCVTKESTDGGITWTEALQDNQPALLNVVINSTEHHVPPLVYGRYSGSHIPLYDVNSQSWVLKLIPEAGLSLAMDYFRDAFQSALRIGYRVFVVLSPEDGSTVSLDAVVSDMLGYQDGIPTYEDDSSMRFVGLVYPIERVTGFWAPICCPDELLVWNQDNRKRIAIGKRCPYAADTSMLVPLFVWFKWNNDDYRVRLLLGVPSVLTCYLGGMNAPGTNVALQSALIVDALPPPLENTFTTEAQAATSHGAGLLQIVCEPGFHTVWPAERCGYMDNPAIVLRQQAYSLNEDRVPWIARMFQGTMEA